MIESRPHWTDDPPQAGDWKPCNVENGWTAAVETLLAGPPIFQTMTLHGGKGVDFEYRLVP